MKKGDIGKIRELIEHRGGENWPPAKVIAESPMLTALEKKRVDIAALLTGYNLGVHDRGAGAPEPRPLPPAGGDEIRGAPPVPHRDPQAQPVLPHRARREQEDPAAFSIEEGAPHDREVIDALIGSIN